MKASLNIKEISPLILTFILSLFLFSALYPITQKPKLSLTQQDSSLNFNNKIMKVFSLGQMRLISGLLWSETLLNSDIQRYVEEDLKNWMFLRLKSITTLDPHFYEAYLYGSIYLSIIKDDERGATYLYDKGLQFFPDDYYLNINASFHFFYEVGDVKKSIALLEKVVHDPRAPAHLISLLARMKSQSGDLKGSYDFIYELYKSAPEKSPLKKSYAEKLYAVKAEIDLSCLNKEDSGKSPCHNKDFYGNPYILIRGKYQASQKWTKLRVKNNKKKRQKKEKSKERELK